MAQKTKPTLEDEREQMKQYIDSYGRFRKVCHDRIEGITKQEIAILYLAGR